MTVFENIRLLLERRTTEKKEQLLDQAEVNYLVLLLKNLEQLESLDEAVAQEVTFLLALISGLIVEETRQNLLKKVNELNETKPPSNILYLEDESFWKEL